VFCEIQSINLSEFFSLPDMFPDSETVGRGGWGLMDILVFFNRNPKVRQKQCDYIKESVNS
jgi:hypothetical protein